MTPTRFAPGTLPGGGPPPAPAAGPPPILEQARRVKERLDARFAEQAARQEAVEGAVRGMMVTDPDAPLVPTPAFQAWREKLGLQAYSLVVRRRPSPTAAPGEGAVAFFTLAAFVPRVGDLVMLPDGRECVVKAAQHAIGAWGPPDALPDAMVSTTNVLCELTGDTA